MSIISHIFKQEVTHVVGMAELQLYCRLHFSEDFTIYNVNSLPSVTFEIPNDFRKKEIQMRNAHNAAQVQNILKKNECDLSQMHAVVYHLAMIGILNVHGTVRIDSMRLEYHDVN